MDECGVVQWGSSRILETAKWNYFTEYDMHSAESTHPCPQVDLAHHPYCKYYGGLACLKFLAAVCNWLCQIHNLENNILIDKIKRLHVCTLGVSPSLVSRYCEGYGFVSTWGLSLLTETANRADSGQLQFWFEPSEILNCRFSKNCSFHNILIP